VKNLLKHRWLPLVPLAGVGMMALVWGCEWRIEHVGGQRCLDEIEALPDAPVALVLGAAPKLANGRANLFFRPRLEAAARLFKAGKVRALIVSGDNGSEDYDEPTEMKRVLVELGVPEKRVVCDYAGFRTLDSMVRAKEVFGQARFIVVSQRFHNERAVYLARAFGIEAWGLNAPDVPVALSVKTYLREKLARVKAVLDVNVFRTGPRFLGQKVEVPLD
jgi:SanA protein